VDRYDLIKLLAEARSTYSAAGHLNGRAPGLKAADALLEDRAGPEMVERDGYGLRARAVSTPRSAAHVLLEHEFSLLLAIGNECRSSSSGIEQEAAELSGELHILRDAARTAAFKEWSDQDLANYFQVSLPMARWPMSATGVRNTFTRWAGTAQR
jgi:hypothetical protein